MTEFICETCKGRIHEENQDRVVARCPSEIFPFSLIAVADGISSCAFGGSVARWVVEQHVATDYIPLFPDVGTETVFRNYLATLNEQFRAEFADLPEMLESGACLSMAVNRANETHCLWVGDAPIYETKQQNGRYITKLISRPDVLDEKCVTDWFGGTSPFELKHVQLSRETEIVTITSDGVIHDANMLNSAYEELGFTHALAKAVQEESLRNPRADDVSIVAMKIREQR
ncbi:MAG: protein phosphatase 2C domain-containing protein [Planctomycetota bacterium]